jgi:hypothetical protein
MEQASGAIATQGPERITTNQFRQFLGMVGGTRRHGAHFVEHHIEAGLGDLPGGFGTGEAAPNNVNGKVCHGVLNPVQV